jgi:hypothetical protein
MFVVEIVQGGGLLNLPIINGFYISVPFLLTFRRRDIHALIFDTLPRLNHQAF